VTDVSSSGLTDAQAEFLKILRAHRNTLDVCTACASTTRDLATEVLRGGLPRREDLEQTIAEADRVLADVEAMRQELDRVLVELGPL
jgi:hypothetical protein